MCEKDKGKTKARVRDLRGKRKHTGKGTQALPYGDLHHQEFRQGFCTDFLDDTAFWEDQLLV